MVPSAAEQVFYRNPGWQRPDSPHSTFRSRLDGKATSIEHPPKNACLCAAPALVSPSDACEGTSPGAWRQTGSKFYAVSGDSGPRLRSRSEPFRASFPRPGRQTFSRFWSDIHAPMMNAWKAARHRRTSENPSTRPPPDIILIEMYPFGRRQMRFEIEPLVEAAAKSGPTRR